MQPMPAPPMLRAAGLTMTYPGGSTALAGLTVDVPAGSVGLVGSSLVVSSQRAGELAQALPVVAREAGIRLLEVRPLDDSLERASSGSCSGDRVLRFVRHASCLRPAPARHSPATGVAAPVARPLRRRGRLHVEGVPTGQALVGRAPAVPRRGPVRLAGDARRHDDRTYVRIRAEQGLFGLVLPLTCLVIGDAVLGADLRAGTFTFPWLSPVPFPTIVIGRWLGGWESQQVYAGLADDAGGWRLLRDGTPSGWGAVVRLATVLVVTLAVAVWRLAHLKPTGGDE